MDLIAKLREQRRSWVTLADGRLRVRIIRPPETELHKLIGGVDVDLLCKYVDGWSGFTEADLLGSGIGGDVAVEFDHELFAEWARDHVDVVREVAEAILAAVSKHLEARKAVAGN